VTDCKYLTKNFFRGLSFTDDTHILGATSTKEPDMINLHTEFGLISLDFDPSQYKKPANAAKALYKALCEVCRRMDLNPDIELQTPEQSLRAGYGRNWRVSWESGPYQWAIGTSYEVCNGPHWYTEPYYSFDLCFTN